MSWDWEVDYIDPERGRRPGMGTGHIANAKAHAGHKKNKPMARTGRSVEAVGQSIGRTKSGTGSHDELYALEPNQAGTVVQAKKAHLHAGARHRPRGYVCAKGETGGKEIAAGE